MLAKTTILSPRAGAGSPRQPEIAATSCTYGVGEAEPREGLGVPVCRRFEQGVLKLRRIRFCVTPDSLVAGDIDELCEDRPLFLEGRLHETRGSFFGEKIFDQAIQKGAWVR